MTLEHYFFHRTYLKARDQSGCEIITIHGYEELLFCHGLDHPSAMAYRLPQLALTPAQDSSVGAHLAILVDSHLLKGPLRT